MAPDVVVLLVPVGELDACVQQGCERADAQGLVSLPGVERLDVAVLPRLARWDEHQADDLVGLVGECVADHLGSVVHAQVLGEAMLGREAVENRGEVLAGDG